MFESLTHCLCNRKKQLLHSELQPRFVFNSRHSAVGSKSTVLHCAEPTRLSPAAHILVFINSALTCTLHQIQRCGRRNFLLTIQSSSSSFLRNASSLISQCSHFPHLTGFVMLSIRDPSTATLFTGNLTLGVSSR